MGALDKFLNFMQNMNGRDDDDDYDDDYDDDEFEDYAPKKSFAPVKETPVPEAEEPVKKPIGGSKVTPIKHNTRKVTNSNGMELCVIRPQTFEEARDITETLLANRAVVLNLEGVDVDIAQRIIDFASGSCFAIDGNLQKISRFIFIITPSSVDISGDFQGLLGGSTFDSPLNVGI